MKNNDNKKKINFVFAKQTLNKNEFLSELENTKNENTVKLVPYISRLLYFFFNENSFWWIIFFILKIITTSTSTFIHIKGIEQLIKILKNLSRELQNKNKNKIWDSAYFFWQNIFENSELRNIVFVFLFVSLSKKVLEWVRNFKVKPNIRLTVLKKMWFIIFKKPYSFFISNSSGKILERLEELPDNFYELVFTMLEQFITFMFTLLSVFIHIYDGFSDNKTMLSFLFFTIFIWIIIHISIGYYNTRYLSFFLLKLSGMYSKIVGAISDSLRNIFVIKIFNKEEDEWKNVVDKLLQKERRYLLFANNITLKVKIWFSINYYSFLFILFIPIIILAQPDNISALFYGIHEMYDAIWDFVYDFFETIDEIYKMIEIVNFFTNGKDLMKLYNSQFEQETQEKILYDKTLLSKTSSPQIEFDNVSLSVDGKKILRNIKFKINSGEKIGIVGTSGSGKTTISNIILGLVKPTNGKVYVNNVNFLNINKLNWSEQITVVPQIPFLFERSFKDNMLFAVDSEQEVQSHIHSMIQKTNCEFIYRKSNRLNFNIGRGGEKISGGQRQRLSILRALFRLNSKLLILDEATSAMDGITEATLNKTINEYSKDKTLIIIAHKLHTMRNMDKILVLKDGEVVEFDSFENLTKKKGEFYQLLKSNEKDE